MPSFNSAVQICNYALGAIGHGSLITELEEESTAARWCNLFYERDRVSLLEDHDWSFARKTVKLVEVDASVPWWDYAYQTPGDVLKAIRLVDQSWKRQEDTRRIDYERALVTISGDDLNVIRTDLAGAWLTYTKDITDPARYPQSFVDALAYRLASSIATPMTGDMRIANQMADMATAMLFRAQQRNNDEGEDTVDWWEPAALEARQ